MDQASLKASLLTVQNRNELKPLVIDYLRDEGYVQYVDPIINEPASPETRGAELVLTAKGRITLWPDLEKY